jgi:lipopolysaccharide exporter
MPSHSTASLKSMAWEGMRWTAVASAARMVLQFGLVVTLARLLTPSDFGVMSACLIVSTLVETVTVTSVGPVLVQRASLSEADIRTAFTLSMVRHCLLL